MRRVTTRNRRGQGPLMLTDSAPPARGHGGFRTASSATAADAGGDGWGRSGRQQPCADQQSHADPNTRSSSPPMLRSAATPPRAVGVHDDDIPAPVLRLPLERPFAGSGRRADQNVCSAGGPSGAPPARSEYSASSTSVTTACATPSRKSTTSASRAIPTKTGRSLSLRIRAVPKKPVVPSRRSNRCVPVWCRHVSATGDRARQLGRCPEGTAPCAATGAESASDSK